MDYKTIYDTPIEQYRPVRIGILACVYIAAIAFPVYTAGLCFGLLSRHLHGDSATLLELIGAAVTCLSSPGLALYILGTRSGSRRIATTGVVLCASTGVTLVAAYCMLEFPDVVADIMRNGL